MIYADIRPGKFHIPLEGECNVTTVKEVRKYILTTWNDSGNIFIHTQKPAEIFPDSYTGFQKMVDVLDLSREHIYFSGTLGKHLCNGYFRIIVPPAKTLHSGGCGQCRNFRCEKKERVH